jgi:hypothetical protein
MTTNASAPINLQAHQLRTFRFQRGSTRLAPARPLYGTQGRCACGWTYQANEAPSKGGERTVTAAWRKHIDETVRQAEDEREASMARHPTNLDPVVYPADVPEGAPGMEPWDRPTSQDLADDEAHDLMGPDWYSPVARAEWDD